jgi:Fur family transcriptional regulator, ferric uptake regulator
MAERGGADWASRAHRGLELAGYRAGGARGAVVDHLSRQDCCLSAQEIADGLRAQGRGVGIASVYRAIDLLHGMGLVQRVDVGEGGTRYEPLIPGGEHHHHVVCDSCGRVAAFEDAPLEQAIDRLGRRLGHAVSGHEVVIRGTCPRCARRRRPKRAAA